MTEAVIDTDVLFAPDQTSDARTETAISCSEIYCSGCSRQAVSVHLDG